MNKTTLPINYVKVKREQSGNCNICEKHCRYTWDHVPPLGGVEVRPLDQYTILEHMSGFENHPKHLKTQNGVKFRTICPNCNGGLLGKEYDPTINDFAKGVGRFLQTTISLPPKVTYSTKAGRLLRALFGHLLAAKSEFEETESDKAMREFVLNPCANLPPNLNVFYWVYPYPCFVIIQDVMMLAIRGKFNNTAVFSILKYFPIAYLITDLAVYENLPSLSFYCPRDLDEEIRIPINLSSVRAVNWPETVDDGNIIGGGGSSRHSSIVAIPKGTKIQRSIE